MEPLPLEPALLEPLTLEPAPAELPPIPIEPLPAPLAAEVPPAFEPAPAVAARPRRRRRIALLVIALFGAMLLALFAVFAIRLYPWLRMPSEPRADIDKRWKAVEAFAQVPPATGDDTLLLEAAEAFKSFQPGARALQTQWMRIEDLTPEQKDALDKFSRWKAAGASFVPAACGDTDSRRARDAISMFRLGTAALLSANGMSDIARIEAVLALGRAMRKRGRLVDFAVGSDLAAKAAEWRQHRGVEFPPQFDEYRPNVDEIRRAVARDAVCVLEMVGPLPAFGFSGRIGSTSGVGPPFGIVRFGRERVVFQQFHGRALEQARAAGDDYKKIADVYATIDRQKSVLLTLSAGYAGIIRKTGENKTKYDAMVASRPRRTQIPRQREREPVAPPQERVAPEPAVPRDE